MRGAVAALMMLGCATSPPSRRDAAPRARLAEPPRPPPPLLIDDACFAKSVRRVAVGANEVVWWCSDGAVRLQRFASSSVEAVGNLPGRGWLAVDEDNIWIAHDDIDPTLYRMALSGGPFVNLGAVPRGELVVGARHLWIKEHHRSGPLYRVPKSGGVAEVVETENVTAVAPHGGTLLYLQQRYGGRAALRSVNDELKVTTVVDDLPFSMELVAGGGWAYSLGGVRIDLTRRTVEYAWACGHPIVATDTRVVMRCSDGTVQVAAHGVTETVALPDVPSTRHLVGGRDHICWIVGEKGDQLSCATY